MGLVRDKTSAERQLLDPEIGDRGVGLRAAYYGDGLGGVCIAFASFFFAGEHATSRAERFT